MANIIKVYPTADRPSGGELEVTGTAISGNKVAIDVNVVNAEIEIDPTGLATGTKQDAQTALLTTIESDLDTVNSNLVTVQTNQGTQTTHLSSIDSELSQKNPLGSIYLDYSATNVSDTAYVQLSASLPANVKSIEVFDGGGKAMILALGAASSEVDKLLIPPGGNLPLIPWAPSGRLTVKCKQSSTTVSSGLLVINLFG